jgi:hypothetical protein
MIPMRPAIAALFAACIAVHAAVAQVSVQVDETVDFERFETYTIRDGKPALRIEVQKTIEGYVVHELERRGLHAEPVSPDLVVKTYALVDKLTLEQLADPTTWQFYVGTADVDAYAVGAGTLVVDVLNPDGEALVWRGLVAAPVSGPVSKIERKLGSEVAKMFKRFPIEPNK